MTQPLGERTAAITQKMLGDNQMGWAHVDVILTTGGASRMPMVRDRLKELGGRTLNTSLSPDQSIAHGATYYAGMLLSNTEFAKAIRNKDVTSRLARMKQVSVNARGLGILVQNDQRIRVPHYLIPANSPLPAKFTQTFGTVVENQKRVHLQIVESPATEGRPHVPLGECIIDDLSPNLAEGSEIAVTIAYDGQARVHVTAIDVTGGREATTEIIRPENVVTTEVEGTPEEEAPPETQEPATSVDDFQVEKWANSTDRVAVQLPDDDDEILDLSKPAASRGPRSPRAASGFVVRNRRRGPPPETNRDVRDRATRNNRRVVRRPSSHHLCHPASIRPRTPRVPKKNSGIFPGFLKQQDRPASTPDNPAPEPSNEDRPHRPLSRRHAVDLSVENGLRRRCGNSRGALSNVEWLALRLGRERTICGSMLQPPMGWRSIRRKP
ncbi:MAG: hypothetical protein CM1200mP2_32460 [Planctomycetaceae bacterium]|nr:MAG: hypothetical protein CM1200mP2_32460 [Planctomycetaceae bacterium]